MNPWIIAGVCALWAASVGGAFFYGEGVGQDREIAKQASVNSAIQAAREAMQQTAAEAIAKIKPQNVTIRQETQREIRTNTVYADCKLPAGGLRLANEALTGKRSTQPAGGGQLPRADADGAGR